MLVHIVITAILKAKGGTQSKASLGKSARNTKSKRTGDVVQVVESKP
jgi:hypothetical protein